MEVAVQYVEDLCDHDFEQLLATLDAAKESCKQARCGRINIDTTDFSNIAERANVSLEETKRLDFPSGKKCSCGKETTVGEDEAFGACVDCYAPFGRDH